jgi:hypothetical protein
MGQRGLTLCAFQKFDSSGRGPLSLNAPQQGGALTMAITSFMDAVQAVQTAHDKAEDSKGKQEAVEMARQLGEIAWQKP